MGAVARGPVWGPAVWLAGSLKEIHGAVEKGRAKKSKQIGQVGRSR